MSMAIYIKKHEKVPSRLDGQGNVVYEIPRKWRDLKVGQLVPILTGPNGRDCPAMYTKEGVWLCDAGSPKAKDVFQIIEKMGSSKGV